MAGFDQPRDALQLDSFFDQYTSTTNYYHRTWLAIKLVKNQIKIVSNVHSICSDFTWRHQNISIGKSKWNIEKAKIPTQNLTGSDLQKTQQNIYQSVNNTRPQRAFACYFEHTIIYCWGKRYREDNVYLCKQKLRSLSFLFSPIIAPINTNIYHCTGMGKII